MNNSSNDNILSNDEQKKLNLLESIISQSEKLNTFVEIGEVLCIIRQERLYRATYKSFENYCRDKWQMNRRKADLLINAADVVKDLASEEKVRSMDLTLPDNERQARPLAKLETPEERQQAWSQAVEHAANGKPTASDVEKAVAAVKKAPEPLKPAVEAPKPIQPVEVITEEKAVDVQAEVMPEAQPSAIAPEATKPKELIQKITLDDGRTLFIQNSTNSKPTFNRTNDMVDWAWWTWNPVTGCWHGCKYCYARDIANRFYDTKFEPTFHPDRLTCPKNTKLPSEAQTNVRAKNVFTCSMADLFGAWVPEEWIIEVFKVVIDNPEWNFLFLTKFPQRLQEICDKLNGFPDNAWVGTTVDTQTRVRIAERAFAHISASVKWLSCEPLLEELTFNSLNMFDWVVIGGQSRSTQTPDFQPEWEWVENLYLQARKSKCNIYWKENLTIRPKEYPW